MSSVELPRKELGLTPAEALSRIPMFPLPNVVLFPNALLPLHIFEPRYRKMVRDVLASNKLMVVAQLLDGESPFDDPPSVAPIAGLGEVILAHELPDGRFNLILHGRARIHIEEEFVTDEPYRLVAVSDIPDDPLEDQGEVGDAETSLRALVGALASQLPEGGDLLKQVVAAQKGPAALVDVLAGALVADPRVRQSLLETTDVSLRIERVSTEVAAMTARIAPDQRVH